eukprot:COSAG01_NODE_524_length_15931_cov_72.340491_9_plen_76_part_00
MRAAERAAAAEQLREVREECEEAWAAHYADEVRRRVVACRSAHRQVPSAKWADELMCLCGRRWSRSSALRCYTRS